MQEIMKMKVIMEVAQVQKMKENHKVAELAKAELRNSISNSNITKIPIIIKMTTRAILQTQ